MHKRSLIAFAALCAAASFAHAEAPPASGLSYNIGAVTDYRYRGLSQSARKPALQGGIDYAGAGGWYAGAWASTIRWIKDSSIPAGPQAKGPVEIDLYGGYKGTIGHDLSYDVGALQYWYVGNTLKDVTTQNANTFEVYGALTYKLFTAKYSHSLTDLFGAPGSKGSGYLDLSASIDLGDGYSLTPHAGWQRIKGFGTYMDYSLTGTKDLGYGLSASVAVVGSNWKDHFGAPFMLPGSGTKDLGRANLVAGIKVTF
ncbi:TorF family putative porin [Caenimonas aquaedulcis]|uniref:Uncharacterized protein n=1 Tax=Caenimonas aquaedulcis TaxID=2793270 RepID=A0A931MHU6_9BURK|nr:TorF family putative porin [Caenimonas aquaedulcis]MBG9389178.1 hypothetical protein [Caenimonas aquaedulcis]